MRPDAILLDFGGTLDSDGGHWFDRTVGLYRRFGIGVDTPRLKEAFYAADAAVAKSARGRLRSLRQVVREHVRLQFGALGLAGDGVAPADAFADESEATFRRNAGLLARWSKTRRLAVVSNGYGNTREMLDDAGLLPYVSVVIDSLVEGVAKPDPEIFRLTLKRLEVDAARAVHVGDSLERDVRPALLLGMRAVWLAGGREDATYSGERIRTLPELETVLA